MQTDDYTKLTEHLEQFTRLSNITAEMEASFQRAMTELIAECYKDDFVKLQAELAAVEEQIELLAIKHPEWFAKVKTIKTPFGSVASRSTTKIEVPSEEATIALLELRGQEAEPFLRTRKYLSIESLEALDDGELARLKARRVTTEKISISPAKVELGKAVKKAAKEEPELKAAS